MASANFGGGDDFEDDFVPDELVELSADSDESAAAPYGPAREDEKRSVGQETTAANKRKRREQQKERKVLMTLCSVYHKQLMNFRVYMHVEKKSRPLQVDKSDSGWIICTPRSRRIHLRLAI
jgi:hypothetical protein